MESADRLEGVESNAIRDAAVVFDIPSQAVIGTTIDGKIVYWSSGAEVLYGWPADQVIGRDILDVTPSDLSAVQGADIMRMLQNGDSWTGRFNVRGRDEESFTVQVRDVPVRRSNGDLIGMIGISERS